MSSGDRPRLRLLLFNSSGVLAQLRWVGFRRMDLQTEVANDAEEILSALRGSEALPDAVILEHCPANLDAFKVCQRIRDELGHADLPLVVISKTSISHGMLARINDSRCNEVLTSPLAPGQLHFTLCKYLDMPKRCEEQLAAAGPVTVEGETLATGRVCDVSRQGARIQLPEPFETKPGQQVQCSFGAEPGMQMEARVIWRRASGGGTQLAVQFADLPAGVVSRLENLATWRLESADGRHRVILHQSLTETSSFSELVPLVDGPCTFELRSVAMINSIGVSRWITMLRQLDDKEISYSFSRCSVAFCTQANYLAEMLGRGKVLSFFIPLECPSCGQEVEREVEADQITRTDAPELPVFDCPSCGAALHFADLPQRFFQFLSG